MNKKYILEDINKSIREGNKDRLKFTMVYVKSVNFLLSKDKEKLLSLIKNNL